MPGLEELSARLSTPVLTPADDGYADAVRTWGPPSAPDVFVRPTNPEEVAAALTWAAESGVEVAVRGGAHGPWSVWPGGLMIDLGHFRGVAVDGSLVRVGGGATWGAVADALAPHGLAVSSGDNRTVGVGGNALGAGVGWLVRTVGLAVDQLVGAEVVTADGRVVRTSAEEHPDLFFALRGGGGNVGVVTEFVFRAAPVADVVFGRAPIDPSRIGTAIRGVRDALRDAPRELSVTLVHPPPAGPFPPAVAFVWSGADEGAARTALAPLLSVPGLGAAELAVVPYADTLSELPRPPGPPPRTGGSNAVFTELTDAGVDRISAALRDAPDVLLQLRFLGGAVADVAPDATALAWRDAEVLVQWIVMVPAGTSDADLARAVAAWAPVAEEAAAVCGTFTQETDPALVERMYPPDTLARLRTVKSAWDPHNLFRRNHNVTPG